MILQCSPQPLRASLCRVGQQAWADRARTNGVELARTVTIIRVRRGQVARARVLVLEAARMVENSLDADFSLFRIDLEYAAKFVEFEYVIGRSFKHWARARV